MSRGTTSITVRVGDITIDAIDAAVASRNHYTPESPFSRSDWVKAAIREKLAHTERSRRKPRRTQPQESSHEELSNRTK